MTASSSITPARIDASSRLPLFALFGGAAVWLALSSVFGLISSLTFHKPSMFADCALLTYGRAYPAWSHLLVYGFCVPAGLGVGLWLLARLGRVALVNGWLIAVGAKLWNLGVLVGLVAILNGQTSGFEWLEMPRYASVILFLAFLLIAICAFTNYSRRSEETLYPSQWFVLAALFWFPWILSTAVLLLQFFPVRGMAQAAIAWWYAGNLLNVWLTLMGLAATFYILPKATNRPLQSYHLALFVLWTVMLLGTWTGIPGSAALPAWMPTLSAVAAVTMLVPALAVLVIMLSTTRGAKVECRGGSLCFTKLGVSAFVLSTVLFGLTACPQISRVTDYTWFAAGNNALRLYGFFAMTIFGAVYHILPRIVAPELVCQKRVRAHFWLSVIGTLLLALPLIAGGISQGLKLVNPSIAFLDVAKAGLMPFRMATLGETLLLVGNFLFLFNILFVIVSHYRALGKAAYADATASLGPVGVKS